LAFKEVPERLVEAGLMLHLGPTKKGLVGGLIADNVELYPMATVTKRGGYRRWRTVHENYPVTNLVRFDDKLLIMAGDLDEYDA